MRHTPGPWTVDHDGDYIGGPTAEGPWVVIGGGNHKAADEELEQDGDRYGVQRKADAHLIAAAPDLLVALKKALDHIDYIATEDWVELHGLMNSAIEKAEGKSTE